MISVAFKGTFSVPTELDYSATPAVQPTMFLTFLFLTPGIFTAIMIIIIIIIIKQSCESRQTLPYDVGCSNRNHKRQRYVFMSMNEC